MSPAAWAFLGAVVGPTLVFVTWLLSRPQSTRASNNDIMAKVLEGALSTTESMRMLIAPLEDEIHQLRVEVASLRMHVTALEVQVRQLGGVPLPPPQFRGEEF